MANSSPPTTGKSELVSMLSMEHYLAFRLESWQYPYAGWVGAEAPRAAQVAPGASFGWIWVGLGPSRYRRARCRMTPVERTYASRRATLVVAAPRACDVEGERERRSGRRWRIGARAMAGTVMLLAVSSAIAGCGDDQHSGGRNPDVLIGGPGDDTIDSRDGKPEVVVCGSGFDTVVADEQDEISASCERVTFRLGAGAENTGSTLLVDIDNTNGGGGRVKVAIDHPFKLLPPCQALECEYQD